MNMLPITIRKRTIDKAALESIQAAIDAHWDKGRKHISKVLCRQCNWHQPNGQLKDMACREVLLTLDRKGLITLPPRLISAHNDKRNRSVALHKIDQTPLSAKLSELAPVRLKSVRHTGLEPLYNSLVHQYHYLGYRQIVGNHLKYIAFINDRPVACLGWGSAAWSVKSRDVFIGWDKKTKEQLLHFVANNSRFLVLPWVNVKCLASKVLALNIKSISDDWMTVYHHPLYLLETFVEQSRFKGTCYKAANWIRVGQTKGIAKSGHDHMAHGNIKDVLVYPLGKGFRKKLLG
jgi:Druantia protein DruA